MCFYILSYPGVNPEGLAPSLKKGASKKPGSVTGPNPDTCLESSSPGLQLQASGLSLHRFQTENACERGRLLEGAESDAQAESQGGIRVFTLVFIMMTTVQYEELSIGRCYLTQTVQRK